MGRARNSEGDCRKTLTAFIQATREIMSTEGIEHVSIRKIASLLYYNSATIYLYFKNVDELINLASVSFLEQYCRALAADMPLMKEPLAAYMHTWELFCKYAFSYPQVFYRLFFTKNKIPLEDTIDKYYELYPEQLADISGSIYDMLKGGSLKQRCDVIIAPLADAGLVSREHTDIINDMSICYFRKLLEERCARPDDDALGPELTEKFIRVLHLLLKLK